MYYSPVMKLKSLGANQTEVDFNGNLVLFSYETPVAAYVDGAFYRTEEKYSVTTSRHINKWLDGAKAETKPQSWFDSWVK